MSSLPSSPAASLLPRCLLFITVLTLKAAPFTCCLLCLSEGCSGQSSHKTLPETYGKQTTVEEEEAHLACFQPSTPLSCCCRGGFDFCWISAQIEWFDLCFVVDFCFPQETRNYEIPGNTGCTSGCSWSLKQHSLPPKKTASKPLAAPPGSWSPWGKAEVLLQKDAPQREKGH